MNKKPPSFEEFFSEISASLHEESGEASLRRINTERILKLVLDDIVAQRHDLQIRVLNDRRISGDIGADILMQIDDYDIRVEILDTPDSLMSLYRDQVIRFQSIFEDNPSTEILVITWTTQDLHSIYLTLNQIDQLSTHPDQIISLVQTAKPLASVINEILENRIKVWGKMLTAPQEKGTSVSDIRKLFEDHFRTCLEEERNHSFILDERKKAAVSLSEKDAVMLLMDVLDQALNGEDMEKLAQRLSHVPQRSRK